MDPIRLLPYGPAACERPHQRSDTCQHPITRRTIQKILLASKGASTHVAGGGEHGVGAVAVATLEMVTAHSVVVLEMADHRLDGGALQHQ